MEGGRARGEEGGVGKVRVVMKGGDGCSGVGGGCVRGGGERRWWCWVVLAVMMEEGEG